MKHFKPGSATSDVKNMGDKQAMKKKFKKSKTSSKPVENSEKLNPQKNSEESKLKGDQSIGLHTKRGMKKQGSVVLNTKVIFDDDLTTKTQDGEQLPKPYSQNTNNSSKSVQCEKTKRTPTFRQLHKRKKQIEKRKALKRKKDKGSDKNSQTDTESAKDKEIIDMDSKELTEIQKPGKIVLPKTVLEATSNWRKLQRSIAKKPDKESLKRKKDPMKMRNPKYRKMDEKTINERVLNEVHKCQDKPSGIWFDDVDEIFIDKKDIKQTETISEDPSQQTEETSQEEEKQLVKPESYTGLTNIVGIDCEMVGIKDGHISILARVSIVNRYGEPIYDKFVKPTVEVTDYRTRVSGIRPEDLKKGDDFKKVRKEVADILKGRILIGHALKNDFKVLKLRHPVEDTRDTQQFSEFRKLFNNKLPALKKLTEKVLSVKIQSGEHSSITDAQAAVRLYTMYRAQWEAEVKQRGKKKKKKKIVNTVKKDADSDKLEVVDRLWDV